MRSRSLSESSPEVHATLLLFLTISVTNAEASPPKLRITKKELDRFPYFEKKPKETYEDHLAVSVCPHQNTGPAE